MPILKRLLARFGPTGALFVFGFFLIIYIALGFLYWQQGVKGKEFSTQIAKLAPVVARPLPSGDELRAKYEATQQALAPLTDVEAVGRLVAIAEKSGLDVDEASGKFRVPSVKFGPVKVGGGTYRVLSFNDIYVQGDYENVMAFLSDLDSGATLETMELTRVDFSEKDVQFIGGEGTRRAELCSVVSAVEAMMDDLNRSSIPYPINLPSGNATSLMGDDPDTEGVVEGFPDITSTVAEKHYTGTGSPRGGYVLYQHDKIATDNRTRFDTVSYIDVLRTQYYYTCEVDGTVRQFDGANVATATEYLGSGESKIEAIARVNVAIYTRPEE